MIIDILSDLAFGVVPIVLGSILIANAGAIQELRKRSFRDAGLLEDEKLEARPKSKDVIRVTGVLIILFGLGSLYRTIQSIWLS